MPDDDPPPEDDGPRADFFAALPGQVLKVLLTAAGFLGFVAVVGGVTVWFHFYTAELPSIQAIDAMPRSELLVNGAVPLVLFGVLGVVAVATCFAIDRGGQATEGMGHSLMVLFAAATIFVVLVAPIDPTHDRWLVVAIVLALAVSHLVHVFTGESREFLVLLALIALLSGVAWLIAHEVWVSIAILVAAALAWLNFRIAKATDDRFTPVALSVFFSLPLFGAVVILLMLANDPLVQPVALIRSSDQGRLVVEAIYIADSDDDVYLGSVATEGCDSNTLRRGSGMIFSIPKNEIVAMRIGRGQTIGDAIRNGPAMARLLVRNAGAFPYRRPKKPKPPQKAGEPKTKPLWPLRHSRDRAVRQEPDLDPITPPSQTVGGHITITGDHFGDDEGHVVLGGRKAQIASWDDDSIEAIVPPKTKTSRVTVQCPGGETVVTVVP